MPAPVIVCATGGSGTRAFVDFFKHRGIYCGWNLNSAGDSMSFFGVLESVIDPVIRTAGCLNYDVRCLSSALKDDVQIQLKRAVRNHLEQYDGGPWVAKNPRQLFLIPFWIALFPDVKIIHVIRDGRDMVLSKNQNQPRKHFEALFAETYRGLRTQSAKFWARSNYQVAKLASENPGSIYTIKIEDLCGQEKHKRIADVCEFTATTLAAAGDELLPFSAQPSFGRGHQIDINNYPSEFKEALKHFGYI